ncbi:hypothetical protein COY27_01045 [Candidatus Woesearchaeota archaeon CG_4_10_14_0_2_um_filter_33_13]|nr:MAG: hypothetical protein COY27_01045 [Candidatus Woesearchaeota archaeon CG_4_10_14_0_2_um_filter_33_13]
MNWKIIAILLALEDKVRTAEREAGKNKVVFVDFETKKRVEAGYKNLESELKPWRAAAPEQSKKQTRTELGPSNVGNVIRNLFDNTVGYGISTYQNVRTRRELKKDPAAAKKHMTVLIPGLFQNIGSQWRLARVERKKGRLVYHVHPHNGLQKEAREDAAVKQLEELKNKTGKNPYKIISGHSDGAALGIGLAQRKKAVKDHKIYAVQARAPSVHGVSGDYTPGQRILIPLAPNDNVRKSYTARRGAYYNAQRRPHAKVYVVAGEHDGLVKPSDAVYKHAKAHYLARGKQSTHFGTSGGNPDMNKLQSGHIDDIVKEHKGELKREQEAKIRGQYKGEANAKYQERQNMRENKPKTKKAA